LTAASIARLALLKRRPPTVGAVGDFHLQQRSLLVIEIILIDLLDFEGRLHADAYVVLNHQACQIRSVDQDNPLCNFLSVRPGTLGVA
jgi:hypothetical protein